MWLTRLIRVTPCATVLSFGALKDRHQNICNGSALRRYCGSGYSADMFTRTNPWVSAQRKPRIRQSRLWGSQNNLRFFRRRRQQIFIILSFSKSARAALAYPTTHTLLLLHTSNDERERPLTAWKDKHYGAKKGFDRD